MAGEKLKLTNEIYEKGYLYYVKNEDGLICLYRAKMSKKGRPKKVKS